MTVILDISKNEERLILSCVESIGEIIEIINEQLYTNELLKVKIINNNDKSENCLRMCINNKNHSVDLNCYHQTKMCEFHYKELNEENLMYIFNSLNFILDIEPIYYVMCVETGQDLTIRNLFYAGMKDDYLLKFVANTGKFDEWIQFKENDVECKIKLLKIKQSKQLDNILKFLGDYWEWHLPYEIVKYTEKDFKQILKN